MTATTELSPRTYPLAAVVCEHCHGDHDEAGVLRTDPIRGIVCAECDAVIDEMERDEEPS